MKNQLKVYSFGYIIPLILQRFIETEVVWLIRAMMSLCSWVQAWLLYIELMQLHSKGFKLYFSDMRNVMDMANFVGYVVYAIMRIMKPENMVPNSQRETTDSPETVNEIIFVNILFSLLLFLAAYKTMFFIRVY